MAVDLNPRRTAMKITATAEAKAGAAKAKALYDYHEAVLKANQDAQREFERDR
jgi:hypothetical protein